MFDGMKTSWTWALEKQQYIIADAFEKPVYFYINCNLRINTDDKFAWSQIHNLFFFGVKKFQFVASL